MIRDEAQDKQCSEPEEVGHDEETFSYRGDGPSIEQMQMVERYTVEEKPSELAEQPRMLAKVRPAIISREQQLWDKIVMQPEGK